MDSAVVVVRCPGYEERFLKPALRTSLALLGGLETIVPRRSRVFVKINHLSPSTPPERGIVTHPRLTAEVVRALLDQECDVTVGDDIAHEGRCGFALSGYEDVSRTTGARLLNIREAGFIEVAGRGKVLDKLRVSRAAAEADLIVNVPKLKTHAFTGITGAVKNLYGLLPLGDRLRFHQRFPRVEVFSQMLLDVLASLPPRLNIMDGIVAMEGLGPAAGRPSPVGLLLAGRDAISVDAAAGLVVGIDPMDIATTRLGHERGLGAGRVGTFPVVGETLTNVGVRGFRAPTVAARVLRMRPSGAVYAFIQSRVGYIPGIDRKRCTDCGECVRICPVGAATRITGRAVIDRGACIRCLCCHEVCRAGAVRLKSTLTRRVVQAAGHAAAVLRTRRP